MRDFLTKDSITSQNQKGNSKKPSKGYSHNRNFSYQYSNNLKNSSQFLQRIPKNPFQKHSMGESTHQSYASIQSSGTFVGSKAEQNNFKNRRKAKGLQGHRKNLSSNFGHSPFLKNSMYLNIGFESGKLI